MSARAKPETLPVELLYIGRPGSDSWPRFLKQCRLAFQRLNGDQLTATSLGAGHAIVLVDIKCGDQRLRELRHQLRDIAGRRPFVIALLPGVAGEASESDLVSAFELGASDFLLSDTPSETVRQRLRFLARAISVPTDRPMLGRATAAGQTAWVWNLGERQVELSRNFSVLLGETGAQAMKPSKDFLRLVHPDDRRKLMRALRQVRHGLSSETVRHRLKTPEGETLNLVHTLEQVDAEGPTIRGTLELLSDHDDHEPAIDPVTGLAGMASFERMVTRLLNAWTHSRHHSRFAVMLINLDRFRNIPATYGRTVAGEVLAQTADRLKELVQEIAVERILSARTKGERRLAVPHLLHLSGDEFAVVTPGIIRRQDVRSIALRLLSAFETPFTVNAGNPQNLHMTASIGIAFPSPTANTIETLLRDAHAALGEAKKSSTSSIEVHSPSVAAIAFEKMELEHRMRHALADRELQIYYQPQVEIASGSIVGVEALVRWMHPRLGLIQPDAFIEIAEKAGLTSELGSWVLRESMTEMHQLEQAGLTPMNLAVNLSADIFRRGTITEEALAIARESGFEPTRLSLEVTESLVLEDPEAALQTMIELRRNGIQLALDDFGTGYSSLSYLKALPFDYLKIDQTFIEDLMDKQADLTVLRGIIAMAKTLGMTVVAEGVENRRQLDQLTEEGVDLYQGFLCSVPVPAADLKSQIDTFEAHPEPQ